MLPVWTMLTYVIALLVKTTVAGCFADITAHQLTYNPRINFLPASQSV